MAFGCQSLFKPKIEPMNSVCGLFSRNTTGFAGPRGASSPRRILPASRSRVLQRIECKSLALGDVAKRSGALICRMRHLSISLFTKMTELPPEGSTLMPREEQCNVQSLCRTAPAHVWEEKCSQCGGAGLISMKGSRGRRTLATCLICDGVGIVRHVSTEPEFTAEVLTIARPPPVIKAATKRL